MRKYRLRWRGRDIPIGGDFVIGRSSSCDLKLSGALVSREHARIVVGEAGVLIEDLESRNGVRVDGELLKAQRLLAHGDVITIGVDEMTLLEESLMTRAETLSTLPPSRIRLGESDVDGEEATTVVARIDKLSKREREVFELIARGHTQREIAAKLFVSVKTIESHRTHIGEKLGCRTRAEIVRFAIIAGILRPDPGSSTRGRSVS